MKISEVFIVRKLHLIDSVKMLPRLLLALALSLTFLAGSILPAFDSSISEAQANPMITSGQEITSWGANASGQLGLGDRVQRNTPTQIGDSSDWMQTATGSSFAMGLYYPGRIYAWGSNQNGQLGQGNFVASDSPVPVGSNSNWIQIAAGSAHAIALNANGEIWSWGSNTLGQVGNGGAFDGSGVNAGRFLPTRIMPATSDWVYIAAASSHSFAINEAGELWAWGMNGGGGALFTNLVSSGIHNTPTRIPLQQNWVFVDTGNFSSALICEDGFLYTWGGNQQGVLGQNIPTVPAVQVQVPTRVGPNNNWVQASVSGGGSFMLALNDDGQIFSAGHNNHGQLGIGTIGGAGDNRIALTHVETNDGNWAYVSAGNLHAAALTDTNQLWIWGNSANGRLGLPGTLPAGVSTPTRVGQASNWIDVSAAGNFTIGVGPYEMGYEVPLTKTLRMPESVTTPNVTFNFEVERYGWKALNAPSFGPTLPAWLPNIDNPSIAFTAADTGTVTGDVRTVSRTFTDLLDDVNFANTGVHAWTITEVSSAPATADPYSMGYSPARYLLRVYVEPGIIRPFVSAATLTVLDADNPSQTVGGKTETALFTNTLTRVVGTPGLAGHNALEVQKEVDGPFAPNVSFDFTLNLLEPSLGGIFGPLNAQVVDIANPNVSLRAITFTDGSADFYLYHYERLIIPQLYAGTGFNATEIGNMAFFPEATVILGGNFVAPGSATTPTYSEDPGDDIVTATHVIANEGRNAIEFVNAHIYAPPTGLWTGSSMSPLMLVIPAALIAALVAFNHRKRIEEDDYGVTKKSKY